ncbi:DUF7556 family protein [Halovivax gelatinilyticus]|uniref:DUF7556 family protein n=1 Tax=Halovivax gelatinilyticus TaxID=2961597 RepID=UPI0020CA6037|nr:hypothetical protein [Halovivax gelatinilyticus]
MVMGPHPQPAPNATVVSSIDSDSGGDEYVIADISTDDAWLSMEATAAPALTAWR